MKVSLVIDIAPGQRLIVPLSCGRLVTCDTQGDPWDVPNNPIESPALTEMPKAGPSSFTSMASDVGFGAVDALLKKKRRNSRQALPTDSAAPKPIRSRMP